MKKEMIKDLSGRTRKKLFVLWKKWLDYNAKDENITEELRNLYRSPANNYQSFMWAWEDKTLEDFFNKIPFNCEE